MLNGESVSGSIYTTSGLPSWTGSTSTRRIGPGALFGVGGRVTGGTLPLSYRRQVARIQLKAKRPSSGRLFIHFPNPRPRAKVFVNFTVSELIKKLEYIFDRNQPFGVLQGLYPADLELSCDTMKTSLSV